jgi:hypothetical protein
MGKVKVNILISGFPSNVHEICLLQEYYAASNHNPLPKFRDNVLVPSSRANKSRTLEGTVTFSRNVVKGLPLDDA